MASQSVSHIRGTVSKTASENISANTLVECHTTAGQVSLCPAAGCPVAVAYDAVSSGSVGDFQLLTPGDVMEVTSSGTVTIGDYVAAAASGQVVSESATRSANTIGVAESTVSGSGLVWIRLTV